MEGSLRSWLEAGAQTRHQGDGLYLSLGIFCVAFALGRPPSGGPWQRPLALVFPSHYLGGKRLLFPTEVPGVTLLLWAWVPWTCLSLSPEPGRWCSCAMCPSLELRCSFSPLGTTYIWLVWAVPGHQEEWAQILDGGRGRKVSVKRNSAIILMSQADVSYNSSWVKVFLNYYMKSFDIGSAESAWCLDFYVRNSKRPFESF